MGQTSSFTRRNYAKERITGFYIHIQDSFMLPFRLLIHWYFNYIGFRQWYNEYLPLGFIHLFEPKKYNAQLLTNTEKATFVVKLTALFVLYPYSEYKCERWSAFVGIIRQIVGLVDSQVRMCVYTPIYKSYHHHKQIDISAFFFTVYSYILVLYCSFRALWWSNTNALLHNVCLLYLT